MKCAACNRRCTAADFGSRLVRGVPKPYKSCIKCRAKATKQNSDPKVKSKKKATRFKYKQRQDEYNHLPDVKMARQEAAGTPANLEKRRAFSKLPETKKKAKAWEASKVGKASRKCTNTRQHIKRKNDPGVHLGDVIQGKLVKMLRGTNQSSTISKWTEFDSHNDIKRHFENQFEDGMSWTNYGSGNDKWNIGHRIARAQYDHSNPEDVRRCWSKKNLFPQWQTENLSLGAKLPSSKVLAGLADVHPIAWSV